MNISFYSAASGMIAQQEGLNIYSNNIANINTVGFKAERPGFAECLYTVQRQTEPEWETGHGQYVMKTDLQWQQGTFNMTDQDLDFALPNDGFFMVVDRNGDTYLTRDGAFTMTMNNDAGVWELCNGKGEYVLDYEGNHIPIPFKTEERVIDGETVEVQTDAVDYNIVEEAIGVFTVPNNWGLEQRDSNHLLVTDRSGAPTADDSLDKLRMALEMSTTDLAGDMVRIIETQRSYQLNAKLVQTSDELMRIANSLRT
ncbi:MAG: flagellar hook-basal body protein [Oscillospiraceae bacterium]|jgi:flagellar basal-body rod protein FlgG|nr:flagellar hook-basal body protein [Oscillospiraceae bacterium]